MGNNLVSSISKANSLSKVFELKMIVRVMKNDGKILVYRTPILAKDLLVNFKGFGVSMSKDVSLYLPPNYKLKTGGVKRIKVVITKQQLEDLLTKKVSIDEMIVGLQKGMWSDIESPRCWSPKLDSIPEGNDTGNNNQVISLRFNHVLNDSGVKICNQIGAA